MKDWKGGKNSIYTTLGASNHVDEKREENDFYATDPVAAEWLLKLEPQITYILENAVGVGYLAKVFNKEGKLRAVSDLIDRGYHPGSVAFSYGKDFMQMNKTWKGDIVTNPPYAINLEWAQHCLEVLQEGHYLALFMKITFLEGKERKKFFKENPPIRIWVSSSRIACAKNNKFEITKMDKNGNIKTSKVSSAACYGWFIWQKGYKGDTVIKWFN